MWAIAGVCYLNSPDSAFFDTLRSMIGVLRHRGPDEAGIYLDDWVGLGHARLSIIDVSSGAQPIHNMESLSEKPPRDS